MQNPESKILDFGIASERVLVSKLKEHGRLALALRFVRDIAEHRRIWIETLNAPMDRYWTVTGLGIELIIL